MSAASAPTFFASCVNSIASRVEFEPVPAITGTRPPAISTQRLTNALCSSWFSVGDSPVVPQGTSA